MSDILTEPDPRNPGPARHPGAFLPGASRSDRASEYGGPAPAPDTGTVVFGPQRHPATGRAGQDEPAPTLGDAVGPAPAIGEVRR